MSQPAAPRARSSAHHQVAPAARRVVELARQLPGRVAELGLKVPHEVSHRAVVEALAEELAQVGLVDVRINVSPGGGQIELDAVEFEP